ncbi:MAG: CBS domain-containing protein [Saccharolobus sp.]|jgi:CBS domain-containing protein|uniref:CBS domain-containing protein n=1 Tax=Saccharolobus sp. TaxID=2100761 RepID=UPI0028CD8A13|nr:CBS domain-containing protein [Saccharolobus sp.]MDT7861690.1 CBS domain-containing protein [Saccharolobus sp.]
MSLQVNGSEIISLNPNAYVLDILYFMRRNNIRRIVISDSNKVIGVFTVDNAIRQILENKLEVKVSEIKLKKPVFVKNNNIKEIVNTMLSLNSDFVIYSNKYIITEKDVIRNFNWNLVKEKVSEISREAIIVEPFTKISTCIEIMLRNSIRHLPVVNGIPLGIVSARDIAYSYDIISLNSRVENIMNVNLVSVEEDSYVKDSVKLMIERNIGSIIVKTGIKRKVKIFTNRDLIRLIHNYVL